MQVLLSRSMHIRSFNTHTISQNWVVRNVKDNVEGTNWDEEKTLALANFFKKFYDDLENDLKVSKDTEEKKTPREKSKQQVFELLKENCPTEKGSLSKIELEKLQIRIEELTLTFKEGDIFSAAPEMTKLLIKKELPSAKDYLRSLKLTDEDIELVEEMGHFSIEALLIHVICCLYKSGKTHVRLATIIDQIERAVRTHAGLMKSKRSKGMLYPEVIEQVEEDIEVIVDDSNILTDRSVDETTPPLPGKKVKKYPLGIALVELLNERGVLHMKLESDDGAKIMKKGGHYYNQKPVLVSCAVTIDKLPLKINIPMVSPPLDWLPINSKMKPKTLADLKGGYLTGRTANLGDKYGLLSSKDVKNFRVILNDNYQVLCNIMNALQRQAFKINEKYLRYIQDNYQLLVNSNMLQPKFLCDIDTKDIVDVLRRAFKADAGINHSVSFSFVLKLLIKNIEQARYEKFILEMAESYLGYDFYMPTFIDFRGRIYRCGILHFHERDLARSLIIFSDKKLKSTIKENQILLTASAFHFKSFKSVSEAQEWIKSFFYPAVMKILNPHDQGDSLDSRILNEFSIEDKPGLSYVDIAKNAKNPFQFLSSIMLSLCEEIPSFKYNSPITKDASASAFQIISLFLLDEDMARTTNLIPDKGGIYHDIYSNMRVGLLKFLEGRLSASLYDSIHDKMTRKVVKSVFMPKIYGKTYKATRDDLANQIGHSLTDDDCTNIAKLCFEFWNNKYPHFEAFIQLIQNIGWLTSSSGRPVFYIVDFFTTVQDYMCSETDKVWVWDHTIQSKRHISFRRPSNKRDNKKSHIATFVNFIHQTDAYIAMQVVLDLLQKSIPIYTVHDNFITTPGYSEKIAKCYSNAFYNMNSPLNQINQFIIENLFTPLLGKLHPKVEYNVILKERALAANQEGDKVKKRKNKILSEEEVYYLNSQWLELSEIIRMIDPDKVIPQDVLKAVLECNMLPLDPSTGVEWTSGKKKTWDEKVTSTLKAYESVTKTICGDSDYPYKSGKNHEEKWERFKLLLNTNSKKPLTCVHY